MPPQDRAKAAGLTDAGTIAAVAGQAEMILSVCPPHAAADVAWAVHGFRGLYVDANAIVAGDGARGRADDHRQRAAVTWTAASSACPR